MDVVQFIRHFQPKGTNVTQPPMDSQFAYQPNYQQPTPPRRPTSVTVISIIGIVLGILGLLCVGANVVLTVIGKSFAPGGGPAPKLPPEAQTAAVVLGVVGMILWALLLVGSIGALLLKRWGRSLMIGVSIADLIYGVAKLAVSFIVIAPATVEMMNQQPQTGQTAQVQSMIKPIMYGTLAVYWLISLVFPIATLIVMRRKNVVDAFQSDSPTTPM
ncbi:MAG: hypothetical protein H7Z14_12675 [Anaerolineae bacterium]|nr:hypothetical protein [Phycisphaerae bacterium]